jgi:tyrosinase
MTRDLAPPFAAAHLNQAIVDKTLAGTTFAEFDRLVQGSVTLEGMTYHGGGHLGVGGDLGVVSDLIVATLELRLTFE